jgi:hypothetical protein
MRRLAQDSSLRPRWALKIPSVFAVCVALFIAGCGSQVEHPLPIEIRNLAMGASQADLIQAIGARGAHLTDSATARPKVVWSPGDRQYSAIEFTFTEKDRLYLIKLNFKDSRREVYQQLKKAFFSVYRLSWDEPFRLKVKGDDALLYAPDTFETDDLITKVMDWFKELGRSAAKPPESADKASIFFIEITNKKTGEKFVELFNKNISAQDRGTTAKNVDSQAEHIINERSTVKADPAPNGPPRSEAKDGVGETETVK